MTWQTLPRNGISISDVVTGQAKWTVETGNCLETLRAMPDASVDAVVTDPPAGISFMGKAWDDDKGGRKQWTAWLEGIMRECLRVLKPGGHALVWAIPRTSHWTGAALEDAGFEVRDCVTHLFGSGFPKSLNVSKAIDAADGLKDAREVVSTYTAGGNAGVSTADKGGTYGVGVGTAPAVELAITRGASERSRAWDGWGTALKPAGEKWFVAYKPDPVGELRECLLALSVSLAELASRSSQAEQGEACGSVPPFAASASVTPDDLSAQMGTSLFASEIDSSLSIVSSWLRILEDVSKLENTSTIGMESSLITDLRTLKFLLSKNTPGSTLLDRTTPSGLTPIATTVALLFAGLRAKCNATRILSATESVTIRAGSIDGSMQSARLHEIEFLADSSDTWLVRKPLAGTVARNVLEHGTGAINVDACRIGTERRLNPPAGNVAGGSSYNMSVVGMPQDATATEATGRWPANVVLSHAEGCVAVDPYGLPEINALACAPDCPVRMLDEQSGNRPGMSGGGKHRPDATPGMFGAIDGNASHVRGDSGGASRFFYVAKPSTREREAGLDHLPKRNAAELVDREEGSAGMDNPRAGAGRTSKGRANHHPTVKSIALMRWLVRLITPPGGIVLDPFCGSGGTGCAAVLEGFRFIGCEQEPEYVAIARARIAHWEKSAEPQLSLLQDLTGQNY